ncbi:hypothetical protein BGZ83_005093 [Gryganskiella cystojenkinii]|nr:hypothetical protein BGZ83_005093 [Gryganskiella cystojenkinii]
MSANPFPASQVPLATGSRTDGKLKRLAITNVDSWLGCCIAVHVAQEFEKKRMNVEIVALARKTEHLDRLRKLKNVKIEHIDYERKETLEKAFEKVCATILIPEMDDRRVEQAKHLLCAMKKQGVRACMMISVAGANESPENLHAIHSFHEIEKEVQRECDKCFLIMRKSILNQCFLLWSPVVQEKKEFPMTCERSCQMAPLDACDLVCAIERVVVDHFKKERDDKDNSKDDDEEEELEIFGEHHNKTYTLTGPEKITPDQLCKDLSEVTGEKIDFKHVSREDLKKYLESLKSRAAWDIDAETCDELLQVHSVTEDAKALLQDAAEKAAEIAGRVEKEEGGRGSDHHRYFAPNESMIKLLLDELELVKEKKAGFVSHDLEKIIGRKGHPIKDFLRKEKDAFKPRRA